MSQGRPKSDVERHPDAFEFRCTSFATRPPIPRARGSPLNHPSRSTAKRTCRCPSPARRGTLSVPGATFLTFCAFCSKLRKALKNRLRHPRVEFFDRARKILILLAGLAGFPNPAAYNDRVFLKDGGQLPCLLSPSFNSTCHHNPPQSPYLSVLTSTRKPIDVRSQYFTGEWDELFCRKERSL